MHSMDGKITILIVCIDDIILIKNDEAEIGQLKTLLSKEFEIKGMGPLRYFLEIEIAWSSRGILVSQRKYTLDLIQKIRMLGCKLGDIPMEPNHKLRLLRNSKVDRERYQLLVGILIYLSHKAWYSICSECIVSIYTPTPWRTHGSYMQNTEAFKKNTWEISTFKKEWTFKSWGIHWLWLGKSY